MATGGKVRFCGNYVLSLTGYEYRVGGTPGKGGQMKGHLSIHVADERYLGGRLSCSFNLALPFTEISVSRRLTESLKMRWGLFGDITNLLGAMDSPQLITSE
jgi:hypothetical protein